MTRQLFLALLLAQAFLLPAEAGHSRFPRPIHKVAGSPIALATGDLNLDGNTDLIVVDDLAAEIVVFLGRGEGTVEDGIRFAVGSVPQEAAVGDFNGDGHPDVVVAGWLPDASTLIILPGDPQALLLPGVSFESGPGPRSIAVADFNRDGRDDVAVADSFSPAAEISLFLGAAEGMLGPRIPLPAGIRSSTLGLGDFNSDAETDLLVGGSAATAGSASLVLLAGNGDGTFGAPVAVPEQFPDLVHRSIAVADFNRDGHDDLALGTEGFFSSSLFIYLGNGSGGFELADTLRANQYFQHRVGDLDLDGVPDLLTIHHDYGTEYWIGNGDGTFSQPRPGPFLEFAMLERRDPTAIALADFNNDGQLDPAQAADRDPSWGPPGDVWIVASNGDGTYGANAVAEVGIRPYYMTGGDFNADGHADLAVANTVSDDISVLFGNGDGTFQPEIRLPGGRGDLLGSDVNQDGWEDIIISTREGFSVFLSDGEGGFSPEIHSTAGSGTTFLITANFFDLVDFDDDGKYDVVFGDNGTSSDQSFSELRWMPGNGDGSFGPASFLSGSGLLHGWSTPRVASGDFNQDGCKDLTMAVEIEWQPFLPPSLPCPEFSPCSVVLVLAGACDGRIASRSSFGIHASHPRSVKTADVNEDGATDLIVDAKGPSILLGDGQGGFTVLDPAPPVTAALQIGDYDADGHVDLADGSNFHFGDGTGAFPWLERYRLPSARTTADFNSDGLLDFASLTAGTPACREIYSCPGGVWIVLNQGEPPVRAVEIDVRPGSGENVINLASSGVIPVAILSSEEFDAPSEIRPDTVRFSGARVKAAGSMQKPLCHAEDVNADNLPDLLCQIQTQDVELAPGDSVAILEAETFSGPPVRGEDSVTVRYRSSD